VFLKIKKRPKATAVAPAADPAVTTLSVGKPLLAPKAISFSLSMFTLKLTVSMSNPFSNGFGFGIKF
jgi:hypothetical protein